MSVKFDTTKVTPQTTAPQLTSFTGLSEGPIVNANGNDCAKLIQELNAETARYSTLVSALGTTIDSDGLRKKLKYTRLIQELNAETARYSTLVSALGTTIDSDGLRKKLKYTRVRVWERAVDSKNKLLPLLRKKQMKTECSEDLDRMFRILAACLEFLEELYRTTLTLQVQFSLQPENRVLINTGVSEASIPKKGPDKDKGSINDVTSLRSISSDLRNLETEDIRCLQKELNDMHELVFSLNQKVAIQTWEVDPEAETEKCTINIESNNETGRGGRSSVNDDASSLGGDHKKMRCITVIILVIILVIIGGIVGILMGMLD